MKVPFLYRNGGVLSVNENEGMLKFVHVLFVCICQKSMHRAASVDTGTLTKNNKPLIVI